MVFFLIAVSPLILATHTCKRHVTSLLLSVGWQHSQMCWEPPTTYLVFPTVPTHCCGLMSACGCSRLCSLCFSDLVLAAWAIIHSLLSLSLALVFSLGVSVTYFLPVYILTASQSLRFCLTLFSSAMNRSSTRSSTSLVHLRTFHLTLPALPAGWMSQILVGRKILPVFPKWPTSTLK